ncbi:MAG: transcription-repair coupling factor [Bacteroidales bacterium]|nr:transcription-repair coupling factor [Bacteroidales bacterium]
MKKLVHEIFDGSSSTAAKRQMLFDLLKSPDKENIIIQGLAGSSKAFLFASVFLQEKHLSCLLFPDKESASYFFDDLVSILGEEYVLFYPSAYKRSVEYLNTDRSNIILKTEVLNKLKTGKKPYIVITYPGAVIEKVVESKELKKNTLDIHLGEKLSMDFIIEMLNEYGFHHNDFVYEPGTFSIRGSIIDVFSFSFEEPYRIDFFGDEVESIRSFDPNTQLSSGKHKKISIVPNIHEHLIDEEKVSFFDFINKNCKIWLEQPEMIKDQLEKTWKAANIRFGEVDNQKEEIDEEDNICIVNPETSLLSPSEFDDEMKNFQLLEFAPRSIYNSTQEIKFGIEPQPAFSKQFDLLIENLKDNNANAYKTYILSNSEKQIQRLRDIFTDKGEDIQFYPILKIIEKGFVDHQSRICVYTDHQIFERYHRYKTKKKTTKEAITIQELTSLRPGDYVVHVDNGVGKFGGLQKITNDGRVQEVVSIIYDNSDILFVNIHSLHRISKYRDKDGEPPKIHRLGSGHWKRLKEKTKKNIQDIARDLIVLYAQRREQKGYAFSEDSYLQNELESSFMYEDTPDQSTTSDMIKADMEADTPMDRLVCGDVGFGKTELAIRAAFKAVCDSKQVAVLVPTTILALQHYQTFTERLKGMPVNVSYISRLKSSKEIKQTLQKLKEGKLDIIIGTHRLMNKDVEFKDLGLFIIDEEQKFGVAMKEKLRQLKVNVDTLTLTATPIPRTLQFSLMGARDLSVINTPPPNRQPIMTELHSFNSDIIREAIYYEVGRNGQVFFVNNRIQNIYEIESLINKICPEVKTVVAHGQMEGGNLEKIILDYMRGDYDVLISTSIIENGVDIPNANTIIINNANTFGLSDLHQLRGRVGRSNKKAFCYLLAPPLNVLTSEARRRLKAIEEFNELGSGLNIALQDLDIRGAGNILGSEQSGFIADIGFETYNKILNEAIDELKEGEFKGLFDGDDNQSDKLITSGKDCQIETDLEIMFPDYYITSTSERIRLYKQLDEIKNHDELEKYREMIIDRFGDIPAEAEKLFEIIKLKWEAIELGFQKIIIKNNEFIGFFPLNQQSSYYSSSIFANILMYIQRNPKDIMIKENKEKLTLRISNVDSISKLMKELDKISKFVAESLNTQAAIERI